MDEASASPELLDLTTEIVAAYAGSHTLPACELPGLIGSVFEALRKLGTVAELARPVYVRERTKNVSMLGVQFAE